MVAIDHRPFNSKSMIQTFITIIIIIIMIIISVTMFIICTKEACVHCTCAHTHTHIYIYTLCISLHHGHIIHTLCFWSSGLCPVSRMIGPKQFARPSVGCTRCTLLLCRGCLFMLGEWQRFFCRWFQAFVPAPSTEGANILIDVAYLASQDVFPSILAAHQDTRKKNNLPIGGDMTMRSVQTGLKIIDSPHKKSIYTALLK